VAQAGAGGQKLCADLWHSSRSRNLLRGLRAGRRGNRRPGGTRGGWLRQAKGRGGVEARSGKDRGAAGLVSSRVVVAAAATATTTGGGGG